jgi:hypothetical protein
MYMYYACVFSHLPILLEKETCAFPEVLRGFHFSATFVTHLVANI